MFGRKGLEDLIGRHAVATRPMHKEAKTKRHRQGAANANISILVAIERLCSAIVLSNQCRGGGFYSL
jgi:hypothetical protein